MADADFTDVNMIAFRRMNQMDISGNVVTQSEFLPTLKVIGALGSFYVGWLVGCIGFNGPLRQYFSLYRAVSQREGERGEKA